MVCDIRIDKGKKENRRKRLCLCAAFCFNRNNRGDAWMPGTGLHREYLRQNTSGGRSFGRLYDKLYDNMQGAALREEVKS